MRRPRPIRRLRSAVRARRNNRPAKPAPAMVATGPGSGFIRFLGGASLMLLAAITAVISYQHGLQVVHAAGTTGRVAYLVPLVADLMIFASSLALLEAAQHNADRPGLAVTSLIFGIVATVAMNVAAGLRHGMAGALVSALAPVALVLSYETLMGMVRRARQRAAEQPTVSHLGQVEQCPHVGARTVEDAVVQAWLHVRDCEGEDWPFRQAAEVLGIHRNRLSKLVAEADAPPPADEPQPEPAQHTSNGRVHAAATGPEVA